MRTEKIHIEQIGEVVFKRHPRTRHIAIRVRPFEGVSVVFPHRVPLQVACGAVQARVEWILSQMPSVRRDEERALASFVLGDNDESDRRLDLRSWERPTITAHVQAGVLTVRYPRHLTPSDPPVRTVVRRGILAACRIDAIRLLPPRVGELARRHGFSYGRVSVKDLRSRWGSCSSRGVINLNLRLVRLPEHLRDYVILHELVHTRINNHGPGFWHLLEEISPGARALDRELNSYAIVP